MNYTGWGEDAFSRAPAKNNPILLTVEYAACHWCHVPANRGFEDSQIADATTNTLPEMNGLNISVLAYASRTFERPDWLRSSETRTASSNRI